MAERKLRLAVIIASTREGRIGGTPGRWFAGQVESHSDYDLDLIDLAELSLNPVLGGERGPSELDFARRMGDADAFVVVTPEYNHGYPASIKQAIDLLKPEWVAKPVGFVSYGGISGGLRAVEQLRQVFAELHAVTVRDVVSFHNVWEKFDANGVPNDVKAVTLAAKLLLDELAWWAVALKNAKEIAAYPAA